MAKQFFFFKREATVKKVDKDGKPIPLTQKVKQVVDEVETEVDEVVPGKFETEVKVYEDNFNLSRVIRSHTVKEGQVVVLLDDGHEETQKTPVLKNPGKKGPITKNDIIEEKSRVWVQSEILLTGEDVPAYYAALREIEA